nr:MAG TPA: Septum formation initiator [Caudoviricetes sp.]
MRSSFRRLLIGAAFLGFGIYTTIWSNAQTKEIERLQLLNRVTSEELQMVQQVVKEQNAELQEKNKEIAKLKSQPK